MLSFLFQYEKPLAIMALQNSVTTIILKTVGTSFIPSLHMMFAGESTQYPRNHVDTTTVRSQQWDILYLFMYGGLGCYAQYMGYLWTINRHNNNTTTTATIADASEDTGTTKTISKRVLHQARALGFFHVIIAIHHTLWAFIPGYGQLKLERYYGTNNRFPYWLEGLVAMITGYHGYKLLTLSATMVDEKQLIRHKVIVDLSSFCSLIPILGFWPMNIIGYSTSLMYEKIIWLSTSLVPLIFLTADLVYDHDTTNNNKNKDDDMNMKK